jgi:hypothetical protein
MQVLVAAAQWTDTASAIAAIAGVVVGLGGIIFALDQLRKQTRIRTAQHAQDLMRVLVDLARAGVDWPGVYRYVHPGDAAPLDLPDHGDERSRVLAYASGYVNFGEMVGWQIRAHQMTDDAVVEWRRYFERIWGNSKAIRHVLASNPKLFAPETRWLFGRESPPPHSVEHLEWRFTRD